MYVAQPVCSKWCGKFYIFVFAGRIIQYNTGNEDCTEQRGKDTNN